jgi:hypothetical protein
LLADLDEYGLLQDALVASKSILSYVNYAVQECENSLKLADLQRRLDKKSVDSVNSEFKVCSFYASTRIVTSCFFCAHCHLACRIYLYSDFFQAVFLNSIDFVRFVRVLCYFCKRIFASQEMNKRFKAVIVRDEV